MPQAVITKDNVTMQIDTVLFIKLPILNFGLRHWKSSHRNWKFNCNNLRNIIGDFTDDPDLWHHKCQNAPNPWRGHRPVGIKVNRVELKNILPPQDIQNAIDDKWKPS